MASVKWAAKHEISEIAIATHDCRVTILRKAEPGAVSRAVVPVPPNVGDVRPQASGSCRQAPGSNAVTAPLAGVCHLAAEAGGAPFVSCGQTVAAGQTLCTIEAMKVMTSVAAGVGGSVEAILVENGAFVDAGTPLVRLC